jgi:hypothetical protein
MTAAKTEKSQRKASEIDWLVSFCTFSFVFDEIVLAFVD